MRDRGGDGCRIGNVYSRNLDVGLDARGHLAQPGHVAPGDHEGHVTQSRQNVELTNYTEAMYAAREAAMERMQTAALALGGTGVVEVKVTEGPMAFARHAVGFTAYGTVVRLLPGGHRDLGAQMVLPLDDPVVSFDAASLRGS